MPAEGKGDRCPGAAAIDGQRPSDISAMSLALVLSKSHLSAPLSVVTTGEF